MRKRGEDKVSSFQGTVQHSSVVCGYAVHLVLGSFPLPEELSESLPRIYQNRSGLGIIKSKLRSLQRIARLLVSWQPQFHQTSSM